MSSSNASVQGVEVPVDDQMAVDLVASVERPIIGALFRLGVPALELAVLNGVCASDFSDPGCGELFELARQATLDQRPLALVALSADIRGRGLSEAAAAAVAASSTLTLGDVPLLAKDLAGYGCYQAAMTEFNRCHRGLTAAVGTSGDPRDLLAEFETHKWEMKQIERRLRDLLV